MSLIGIGASGDGTLVVAYNGPYIGIYDTQDNALVHEIVNTSTVTKPTDAYIDPENAYLLICQPQGYGLTAWACFKLETQQLLWTNCKMYTLSRPEWYCSEKETPTTSLCLQNNNVYGINLASGIHLETGASMDLEPYRSGKVGQAPYRANKFYRDIEEYNCICHVRDHGVYHTIKSMFDPKTNMVDFEIAGEKRAQLQLDEKYGLVDKFSPVCKVYQRLGTNRLIVILEDGQIKFVDANDE